MSDLDSDLTSMAAAPGGSASKGLMFHANSEKLELPVIEIDEEQIVNSAKRARSLTEGRSALEAQLAREEAATSMTTTTTTTNAVDEASGSAPTSSRAATITTGLPPTTTTTNATTQQTTTSATTTTQNAAATSSSSNAAALEAAAAAGLRRPREFGDEDPSHPNWRTHHKHVFVLSQAGKPIYSRYGDEQRMAPFMAAISAVISFVDDARDVIRHFRAGNHDFVFLLKGPIYLVCVADTGESPGQLSLQLTYVHAQIISILTAGVNKIFQNRAAFDLRNLLGGADVFIDALLRRMEHDASFFVDAVHCARLAPAARAVVGQVLAAAAHPQLLFAIVCANMRLVHLVRPKRFVLQPLDLHLIMNFVSSSSSFRTAESWTPICLPQFNERGFLHAHVSYIWNDVCLVLISTSADSFFELAACKTRIVAQLTAHGALQIVQRAVEAPTYSVTDVGVPGLLHFIYKSVATSQFTSASVGAPYVQRADRMRLFRLYQHVIATMHDVTPPHKIYYYTTERESIVGWHTAGFELYAVFGPLEPQAAAIKACNGLLRWIKGHEQSLFILSAPVW